MQLPSPLFRPSSKNKNKSTPKKIHYIYEMELSGSNIKKSQETEKIPYISGNRNPKKASYISGNGTFQLKLGKIFYTSGNGSPEKVSYIFLKESFCYIS